MLVTPRPQPNTSISIPSLQPPAQKTTLTRPMEISPKGQPKTTSNRRLCQSCRTLENLPKPSVNGHPFQNQRPQINSSMNMENPQQFKNRPIIQKRKADSFISQENLATRQKMESVLKTPGNRSIRQTPKPLTIQSYKTNNSDVKTQIIPRSRTQQPMKSHTNSTNSRFSNSLLKPSVSLNNNKYLGSCIKVKSGQLLETPTVAKPEGSFLQQKGIHTMPPDHDYSKLVLKLHPSFFKNKEPEAASTQSQIRSSKMLPPQENPPKYTVHNPPQLEQKQNWSSYTTANNTSHFKNFKLNEKMESLVSSLINNTLESTAAFTLDEATNSKLLVSSVKDSPSSIIEDMEMFPPTDLLLLESAQPTKDDSPQVKLAKRALLAQFNQSI
ncbi:uncharacterized protein LOC127011627 [Drosophila biarmipes]|uniref:uncharacterized protein LOC127011627 n=1 Tax=Drosophila biarmipes TaxID=125945 RepID=UPI0021CCDEFA|nr:uncharacterized protein LOC127011627 [Drosophila biarmipes]